MSGYSALGETRRPKTFWHSVVGLITHLLGTTVIFLALIILGWFISVFFSWLNGIHPFPDEIFSFITAVELILIYLDTLICAIVLIVGMWRFGTEIIGERA